MMEWLLALYLAFNPQLSNCYESIAGVESHWGAYTNNPTHLGPYQISQAYWTDANMPGQWEDVNNPSYAELTMYRYWSRYASAALQDRDCHTLARIHHAGPTLSNASISYGDKVMMLYCDKCEQLTKHKRRPLKQWECVRCHELYQEPEPPTGRIRPTPPMQQLKPK